MAYTHTRPSPAPTPPKVAYNSGKVAQGIDRLAKGILNKHPDPTGLGLVGVHSGGDLLVRRVEQAMAMQCGRQTLDLDKGLLDISFYRDDWTRLRQIPTLKKTFIPFDINERKVVLIDDVIFTGRTVRAALDALFSLGRPARVDLAVLVDRGHREFPISPDWTGLVLPTERHQSVNVYIFDDPAKDHATLQDHKYEVLNSH